MVNEYARGLDELRVGVSATLEESAHARTVWTIHRFDEDAVKWMYERPKIDSRDPLDLEDFERYGVESYLTTQVNGNLLTTAGLGRLTSLLIAGGGQALDNTHTRIGVGDGTVTAGGGSVPAAVGDTDLAAASGSTHRWFQVMVATYPQQSGAVVTLQSSFASADGNFAWNEFGIDVSASAASSGNTVNALLFNHKTSIAQGTKASGQVWTATASVTFS